MTDKEITELNLKSATYYGAQLQMNHFTEELAELIQAAAEGDPQHIAEEIADVEVMVEQMEYLLSLDTIYIESWATHILLANDIESCILASGCAHQEHQQAAPCQSGDRRRPGYVKKRSSEQTANRKPRP